MNWRKFWLLLIPLISIISLGIGAAIYQKNKLEECSIESIGIIYDIYSIKKRGEFVHYKYTVNGEQYKTSESIRTKDDYVKFNIGDTIRINYACESPNSSRYISENENLSGNK